MTMENGPAKLLQGENLMYYRNIIYLKEMTRQATSLLSRSNALYKNILNDVELTMKVRGLSDSTENRSISPDFFTCGTCGMCHGAPFCILEEIVEEERFWSKKDAPEERLIGPQWKETRKDTFMERKKTLEELDEKEEASGKAYKPWSFTIDENLSPEEILTTYEAICARYGTSNGRRYLLATSLSAEEPKTQLSCKKTSDDANIDSMKMKFQGQAIDCPLAPAPNYDFVCPQYTEQARKKLGKLGAEVLPSCETEGYQIPKRWKEIFCKPRRARSDDEQVLNTTDEEEIEKPKIKELVICTCGVLECACGGKQGCPVSSKVRKCKLISNEDNNYLSTIRNKMERKKLSRLHRRKSSVRTSSPTSSRHQAVATTRRRSSQFLHLAYEETLDILNKCLGEELPDKGVESLATYQQKVEQLARLAAPSSMISVRDWNAWYDGYLNPREELDEDSEGQISDIQSTVSDLSEHSNKSSDLNYKERKMPHSQIPYAEETHNLINCLFDKINLIFDSSIRKNSRLTDFFIYKPKLAAALRKLNLLKDDSGVLRELFDSVKEMYNLKILTPQRIVKQSKIKRMKVISTKCKRTCTRRRFIEGIQIGKFLKYRTNKEKYTKQGNYLGFTPEKRELLRMIESKRFTSCDLVGDVSGRKITRKTFHDDYRLLSNLFDEPSSHLRMSLMDEGMKKRMENYKQINRVYGEPALPEPPECSSQHGYEKVGEFCRKEEKMGKEEIRFVRASQKNKSWDAPRSEEKKVYEADRPCSPQSNKGMPMFDDGKYKSHTLSSNQKARVQAKTRRMISPKRVSQNLLLGSDNDARSASQTKNLNPSHYGGLTDVAGSTLKTASLRKSGELRQSLKPKEASTAAKSAFLGDNSFPPPAPSASSAQKRTSLKQSSPQSSVSGRASRNMSTAESKVPAPRDHTEVEHGSTSKLSSSVRSSPEARRSHFTPEGVPSTGGPTGMMGSGTDFTVTSSMLGGSLVYKNRTQSQSLIVQPGSKNLSQKSKNDSVSQVIPEEPEIDGGSKTGTSQLDDKQELKSRTPKKVQDRDLGFLSDLSLTKLRAMKPADRLGPTKKRLFGIDVGQGINYVQYLRDNASAVDEDKKQEMLNLLLVPREKKKVASGKTVSSKTTLLTDSQQGSLNRESEKSTETITRKKKASMTDGTDSLRRMQNNPIKTLDQIYKEAHGINPRNTPASLIENDYEHEMLKKQQLRKHKIL